MLIGCGEVVESLAVGFDGFGLVGQGGRVELAVAQRLQALEHPGQGLADLLGLARVAAGFECQAALFGLLGLFHQAGDFGELLAEGGLVREVRLLLITTSRSSARRTPKPTISLRLTLSLASWRTHQSYIVITPGSATPWVGSPMAWRNR